MKKTISLVLVLALGLTAEVANADFTFSTPTNLGPRVNSTAFNGSPDISADGLSLYFDSLRPDGLGSWDIWVTTAQTTNADWGTPVPLPPPVNSSSGDSGPCISADGLSLFFASDRPGGFGSYDLWVTTRLTTEEPWEPPANLGLTVNSWAYDNHPSISADALSLYFDSSRFGGYGSNDLWVTTRKTTQDPWGPPVNLGPTFNTSNIEYSPNISNEDLTFFFDSRIWDRDIWVTTRRTADDDWGTAENLGPPVNTSYIDTDPSIWVDGSTLYFVSNRPGGFGSADLWQVSISPVVDFNGDGIVDCADICIMVDHWGTDEKLCDIGPTPFGDGIVDVQDLIVLAEYLFTYPGAVAYWKLDETEGIIAEDSVGDCNGTLINGPVWQPTGGMVAGALQFHGIDDYVSTPFVLNPADGAFSVFVWINGGAPGQVVISQTSNAGGMNWLSADPLDGKLMTELKGTGRFVSPLMSEFVVTDGDWHQAGFVRDGSDMILYVDDIEVARDTTTNLESASGGLYIGAGSDLEPGALWFGLIDDVRIYNRAVTP